MKKYKLLKDTPELKAGEVLTKEGKGYYYPSKYPVGSVLPLNGHGLTFTPETVEGDDSWFAKINEFHTKEEIIEEVVKNVRSERPYKNLLSEHEVLFCMKKHEASIKEQLIEKIEKNLFCGSHNRDDVNYNNGICKAAEIIRNFKSE